MNTEIVFLTRGLPHHGIGGMEIVVWDLARQLVRAGQAVRIITTAIPGIQAEFVEDGVTVMPLNNTPANQYSSLWWRESRRYFENRCVATTLAVISVSASGFGLLAIKHRLADIPFIMQAHGTSWGEVLSKIGSRRFLSILSAIKNIGWLPRDLLAYRKFDAVVAVGERVYQDLLKPPANWTLPKNRLHLINNGIDTSCFKSSEAQRASMRLALKICEQTKVIVSASRLHSQKGLGNGLKAFALFLRQHPDAIYVIAGDGPDREILGAMAIELGIAEQVIFLGSLQRAALADLLAAADVFLFLTDRIEGLPLNVLEALAAGVPAVISAHLQVFPSPWINLVMQRDPASVGATLVRVLAQARPVDQNLLPADYTLSASATHYLNLLQKLRVSP